LAGDRREKFDLSQRQGEKTGEFFPVGGEGKDGGQYMGINCVENEIILVKQVCMQSKKWVSGYAWSKGIQVDPTVGKRFHA
jgi:hypothetical protein